MRQRSTEILDVEPVEILGVASEPFAFWFFTFRSFLTVSGFNPSDRYSPSCPSLLIALATIPTTLPALICLSSSPVLRNLVVPLFCWRNAENGASGGDIWIGSESEEMPLQCAKWETETVANNKRTWYRPMVASSSGLGAGWSIAMWHRQNKITVQSGTTLYVVAIVVWLLVAIDNAMCSPSKDTAWTMRHGVAPQFFFARLRFILLLWLLLWSSESTDIIQTKFTTTNL